MSTAINAANITFQYEPQEGKLAVPVFEDLSLSIEQGSFVAVLGHNGSGKSTLIQHMNGLVKPTSGAVYFDGKDINDSDFDKKTLRSKVGLVFQYPEHQLFETDVLADVCFGPKNLGLSKDEVERLKKLYNAQINIIENSIEDDKKEIIRIKKKIKGKY